MNLWGYTMKKTLALILALLTLSSALISCAGGTDNSASNDTQAASETTEAETTAELSEEEKFANYVSGLPDKDFGGEDFIIFTRSEEQTASWFTRDVFSEGEDGEPINDAVYNRNRILSERLVSPI